MSSNASEPPVVFLVGPTASGKTAVAASLARRIPLEVISADSMQIYRLMPVLSQAPSAAVRKRVRHHLVLRLGPREEYNAARFARDARRLIPSIQKRGRLALVSGGTGLYVHALLDGIFTGPAKNAAFRSRLEARARAQGVPSLHAELAAADPEAAVGIHPNDLRRIVRALEVIHETGEKFSELKKRKSGLADERPVLVYGLRPERADLYRRIDRRTEKMFREGAVEEVRRLLKKPLSMTARMCLGIREIGALLEGRADRAEALEALKRESRRYAKRQITWFKRDTRIRWIAVKPGTKPQTIARFIADDLMGRDPGLAPLLWKKPS